ncbi:MAG: hypothetical protein R3B13_34960 [Polyangiaceae bacterium]
MSAERLSRQVRLAEVGEMGQARLAGLTPQIRNGNPVEREYLERAGVARVDCSDAATQADFRHRDAFAHDAAAEVGAQAWRALMVLRAGLGVGT